MNYKYKLAGVMLVVGGFAGREIWIDEQLVLLASLSALAVCLLGALLAFTVRWKWTLRLLSMLALALTAFVHIKAGGQSWLGDSVALVTLTVAVCELCIGSHLPPAVMPTAEQRTAD